MSHFNDNNSYASNNSQHQHQHQHYTQHHSNNLASNYYLQSKLHEMTVRCMKAEKTAYAHRHSAEEKERIAIQLRILQESNENIQELLEKTRVKLKF